MYKSEHNSTHANPKASKTTTAILNRRSVLRFDSIISIEDAMPSHNAASPALIKYHNVDQCAAQMDSWIPSLFEPLATTATVTTTPTPITLNPIHRRDSFA